MLCIAGLYGLGVLTLIFYRLSNQARLAVGAVSLTLWAVSLFMLPLGHSWMVGAVGGLLLMIWVPSAIIGLVWGIILTIVAYNSHMAWMNLLEMVLAIIFLGTIFQRMSTDERRWHKTRQQQGQLSQSLKRVEYLALHDPLTNLPNRRMLVQQLSLRLAEHAHQSLAVLFVDLDHFKEVNDGAGHAVGDQLLQGIATLLQRIVKSTDFVARQGGDEFIILMSGWPDRQTLGQAAEAVREAIAKGFEVHTTGGIEQVYCTTSIGIAVYPDDGQDAEELMRQADLALYEAKENGRNQVAYCNAQLASQANQTYREESLFRMAVQHPDFELRYLPSVDLRTGRLLGVEALLRGHGVQGAVLGPQGLLRAATTLAKSSAIEKWVISRALHDVVQQAWWATSSITLALNVSALSVADPQFIDSVIQELEAVRIYPQRLELEVSLGPNRLSEKAIESIYRLRRLGIGIVIDGFGQNPWFYDLRRVPATGLKLHRTVVQEAEKDPAWIGALILFARGLHLEVSAQGIERQSQVQALLAAGCHTGQGFYFSPPVAIGDIIAKYEESPRPRAMEVPGR